MTRTNDANENEEKSYPWRYKKKEEDDFDAEEGAQGGVNPSTKPSSQNDGGSGIMGSAKKAARRATDAAISASPMAKGATKRAYGGAVKGARIADKVGEAMIKHGEQRQAAGQAIRSDAHGWTDWEESDEHEHWGSTDPDHRKHGHWRGPESRFHDRYPHHGGSEGSREYAEGEHFERRTTGARSPDRHPVERPDRPSDHVTPEMTMGAGFAADPVDAVYTEVDVGFTSGRGGFDGEDSRSDLAELGFGFTGSHDDTPADVTDLSFGFSSDPSEHHDPIARHSVHDFGVGMIDGDGRKGGDL